MLLPSAVLRPSAAPVGRTIPFGNGLLSVVAGTAYAIWRWFESQRSDTGLSWEAQPAPFPPQPRTENPPRAASNPSPAEPVTATEPAVP